MSRRQFRRFQTGLAVAISAAFAFQPLVAQTGVPPGVHLRHGPDSIDDAVVPNPPARSPTGSGAASGTVPVELLRHPLAPKTRRMLQKALEEINAGHHETAIGQLQEVLAKYPDAAYYAHSFLGVAYLKTDQFAPAVDSFEKALLIVPRDAVNHFNLGLSLLSVGKYERGEEEVRRAAELDPNNAGAKELLRSLGQIKLGELKPVGP